MVAKYAVCLGSSLPEDTRLATYGNAPESVPQPNGLTFVGIEGLLTNFVQ